MIAYNLKRMVNAVGGPWLIAKLAEPDTTRENVSSGFSLRLIIAITARVQEFRNRLLRTGLTSGAPPALGDGRMMLES